MADVVERPHYDRFSALVVPVGFQTIRTYPMRDNAVWRLEITVAARQTDGANRASFRRSILLYRQAGGPVQMQGSLWHTVETTKSHLDIDISYILGANSFSIQVKNAGAVSTRWSGIVDLIQVT